MQIRLTLWVLGISFAAIVMGCSAGGGQTISDEDLERLKGKYDVETLNYFYETVFHEDFSSEKLNNISKWNDDPTIAISGNQSAEHKSFVKEAIAEINQLGLPIRLSLADSASSASIKP